ncbi:MAG: hypothetical protein IPI44_23995 [Sulfuritalea sp.]|nr:hypothetical protein [Sulfuritalea sp.]
MPRWRYCRANRTEPGRDRAIRANPRGWVITTGKSYLDVPGLPDDLAGRCTPANRLGISTCKVGLIRPLRSEGFHRMRRGAWIRIMSGVEEKRKLIGYRSREEKLYDWRRACARAWSASSAKKAVGTRHGRWLVPDAVTVTGEDRQRGRGTPRAAGRVTDASANGWK